MTIKNIKKYQKAMAAILEAYTTALADRSIRKPLSFALYTVWKRLDATEEEREVNEKTQKPR